MSPSASSPARDRLHALAVTLLDLENPPHTLRPEVVELAGLLAEAADLPSAPSADLAAGESRTARGVAISPAMAAMCVEDYVRTVQFIRGTHDAIRDVRQLNGGRLVRVLYAGCGPFATLLVPLLARFSPEELQVTLLDLHAEAIASARRVMTALGLAAGVTGFETMDAAHWRPVPGQPPDVVVLEIMRACLESEPQVAVTRHLLAQAPGAVLVPREVRIDLVLVDPAREFDLEAVAENRPPREWDRIPVGTAFVLHREAVAGWAGIDGDRLPGAELRLPECEPRYQPMLFTHIQIHGRHRLEDHASGLTSPRALEVKGALHAGALIRFHYQLGSHPKLEAEVG